VLADGDHNAVTVRLGRGDGTFGRAIGYSSGWTPFGVAVADLNHDGKLDITAANYGGASVSVLLAAGDGSFGPQARYPMGEPDEDYVDAVLIADYDHDGHLDIATPGGPYVRRGRGDGTFEPQPSEFDGSVYTQAGAAADFNGDGWPDLAFSAACDEIEDACGSYAPRSIAVMLNWTGQPVPPCVVPSIIGATERQATRQLAPAGCRTGQVRHRYSRSGRTRTVIRQRPKSASVRPNNSPVNLVVSRGRRQ
jgi:FG-GAP-like repeat/PASTA domain